MINRIIDKNEKIIWQDKPNKLLFVIGSLGIYFLR